MGLFKKWIVNCVLFSKRTVPPVSQWQFLMLPTGGAFRTFVPLTRSTNVN